uniref:NPH3 domain-containing protein n=1 Tax=Nelumbo nucifera TaxID=4432 RepID=A0A822XM61_NELNU|nr:TPA_asm: hypothetical protein HUJ06_022820 [Nelumbo nucifera]
MTEDYAVGNLVGRTEDYLNEVALKSLAGAISVLHTSENLLPTAEKVKLVSRSIDAVAYLAYKESQFCLPGRTETRHESINSYSGSHLKPIVDWWAEDLTVLRIDIFHRVLMAMLARGFKQYSLGPILMIYAQKSLRGLVRNHSENPINVVFLFFSHVPDSKSWRRKYLGGGGKILSQSKNTRRGSCWRPL